LRKKRPNGPQASGLDPALGFQKGNARRVTLGWDLSAFSSHQRFMAAAGRSTIWAFRLEGDSLVRRRHLHDPALVFSGFARGPRQQEDARKPIICNSDRCIACLGRRPKPWRRLAPFPDPSDVTPPDSGFHPITAATTPFRYGGLEFLPERPRRLLLRAERRLLSPVTAGWDWR